MTKIIPFKKPENPNAKGSAPAISWREDPDVLDVIKLVEATGAEIPRVFRIKMFLNSLTGYVPSRTIAIARQTLKEFSLEELNGIAEKSNEIQWRARPGYFTALVDEIVHRQFRPADTNLGT